MIHSLLTSQQQLAGSDMQLCDRHLQTPKAPQHLTFDQTIEIGNNCTDTVWLAFTLINHLLGFCLSRSWTNQFLNLAALTHRQRDAASSQDFPVRLPDAFAGVFQVIHIHINVPNIGHHKGLIRRCPGATVVRPQHGRLYSDLTRTKPGGVEEQT